MAGWATLDASPKAIRKTTTRTLSFVRSALLLRDVERIYFPQIVALCLGLVGVFVTVVAGGAPHPAIGVMAALYLFTTVAALIAMDARYMILPDSLVAALAMGGLALASLSGVDVVLEVTASGIVTFGAAFLFRITYRWLRGIHGLGFGDVKLAAASAVWIGIGMLPQFIGVAVGSALISLTIERLDGKPLARDHAFAFGPHLAISLWLIWLYQMADPFN